MKKLFMILLVAIPLVMACSHSEIPNSKTYFKSEQKLMQAGHHWDVLAKYEAENILSTVPTTEKIYLSPKNNPSPFEEAFYELLKSQLVSKGATFITQPMDSIPVFSYKVQVIHHKKQGAAIIDLSDIGDIFLGREASEQRMEILITTYGTKENQIIMSDSQIYYLYPDNKNNYLAVSKGRVFKVKDN